MSNNNNKLQVQESVAFIQSPSGGVLWHAPGTLAEPDKEAQAYLTGPDGVRVVVTYAEIRAKALSAVGKAFSARLRKAEEAHEAAISAARDVTAEAEAAAANSRKK